MKKTIPQDANLIPPEAKEVFSGEIFSVYQWPQQMFDGSTATFEMLRRPDTVSVIAIKDDKIIVLKQMQPTSPRPYLGFPGGRAEPNETPLESAKRETQEETGMSFTTWKLLNVIQPVQKIEWFIYTFLATDFESQTSTQHDAGEKIQTEFLSFDEVLNSHNEPGQINIDTLAGFKNLEGLKSAPEFTGREIETS